MWLFPSVSLSVVISLLSHYESLCVCLSLLLSAAVEVVAMAAEQEVSEAEAMAAGMTGSVGDYGAYEGSARSPYRGEERGGDPLGFFPLRLSVSPSPSRSLCFLFMLFLFLDCLYAHASFPLELDAFFGSPPLFFFFFCSR